MIPFRKNLAIAIDGGGIRGLIVTQALTALESHLGMPLHQARPPAGGHLNRLDHRRRHCCRLTAQE
jgi:hypothetical protein